MHSKHVLQHIHYHKNGGGVGGEWCRIRWHQRRVWCEHQDHYKKENRGKEQTPTSNICKKSLFGVHSFCKCIKGICVFAFNNKTQQQNNFVHDPYTSVYGY